SLSRNHHGTFVRRSRNRSDGNDPSATAFSVVVFPPTGPARSSVRSSSPRRRSRTSRHAVRPVDEPQAVTARSARDRRHRPAHWPAGLSLRWLYAGSDGENSGAQESVSHPFQQRRIALAADDVLIDLSRTIGAHRLAGDELAVN